MSAVSSPRKHNFDPSNYDTPDYKKKDGEYKLTDYQAALTIRSWMHKNMPGQLLDQGKVMEGSGGNVTVNGKLIQLTEQEKAAFSKLRDDGAALFHRLDAGENGTHDRTFGEWDIDAAIKNGRLHGSAQSSEEGYWRNRNKDMPTGDAGKKLDDFFSQKLGSDWTLQKEDLRRIASAHLYWDKSEGTYKTIDDPEIIRAAGVLLENWGDIQIGEGNSVGTLSKEEVKKLMSL